MSVSSMAEPVEAEGLLLELEWTWREEGATVVSKRPNTLALLLSDALEGRLEGNWRMEMDLEAGGGMLTLDLSTIPPSVSGSEERAFLLAGDEPLPAASSDVAHDEDFVLSVETVRESCSI